MVKRLIFWLCIATGMVISTGCATAPKTTFSDQLAEARTSLAKIKVDPKFKSMTTQQAYETYPAETERQRVDEGEQMLNEAFDKMLTACQGTLAGFETQGRCWGIVKLSIAIAGTLAGAIVAPALTAAAAQANAAWIAGFAGVSGAANAAQQALSEVGFTPISVLLTRQKTLDDWKAATNDYFNPEKTYQQRALAIQRGLTACTLYAITVPGQKIGGDHSEKVTRKEGH